MKNKPAAAALRPPLQPAPDTGALIRRLMKEHRYFKSALARDMGRHYNTVVDMCRNTALRTDTLWDLCYALKHNFFADIAAGLPAEFGGAQDEQSDKDEEIKELKMRLRMAEAERDILKEVLNRS